MDVERTLLSAALREGTLAQVVNRDIDPSHFVSRAVGAEPATAEVWEWILGHLRRYRCAPSVELFKRRWPGFVMLETSDTFKAVLDEFIRVIKRREAVKQIRHLAVVVDDWSMVSEVEVHFAQAAKEIARLVPTTSVHRYSDSLDRLQAYRERERLGRAPGVSTLILEIDDLTYGVQDHEMLVIEGSTSIGKSSLGVGMAARAYFDRGETPLFMTLEMEGEKLAQRWDAFAAKISYRAIKRMELGEGDLKRWEEIAEKAAESRFDKDVLVIDDMYHPSVERVFSEVEKWDPDFVVVDPIDEISAPSHFRTLYERQGFAARELKSMARTMRKPFVVMAQAGREAEQEGAKISNVAGSIDIVRKADLVVGLHATEEMQRMNKMRVQLLKNRDDEGKGSAFDYFVDVGRMEWRPWRPDDATPVRQAQPVA